MRINILAILFLIIFVAGISYSDMTPITGGNYAGGEKGWWVEKYDISTIDISVDDTSVAFSLKRKDGGFYTCLDYAFKIMSLDTGGTNDSINGNLILQLKCLDLYSDTSIWVNARGAVDWVDYDSANPFPLGVDSITVFDTTGYRLGADSDSLVSKHHILLPPADSARWKWIAHATDNDSLSYWAIVQNLSGNSRDPKDCLEGNWEEVGLKAAENDSFTINLWEFGIDRGQSYAYMTGWVYIFVVAQADSDDIVAGAITGYPVLNGSNYIPNSGDLIDTLMWYGAPISGVNNAFAVNYGTTTDKLVKPFWIPIPSIADELFLIHDTGNGDSLVYFDFRYRLLK